MQFANELLYPVGSVVTCFVCFVGFASQPQGCSGFSIEVES